MVCNIKELRYADGAAIVSHSPKVLQNMIDVLHRAYNRLGPKLKTEMREMMRLSDDNQEPESFTVGTAQLKIISDYRYLGSYLSNDWLLGKEVTYPIGRAAVAFSSLQERVFSSRNPKITTKYACIMHSTYPPCCTVQKRGHSTGVKQESWRRNIYSACRGSTMSPGRTGPPKMRL